MFHNLHQLIVAILSNATDATDALHCSAVELAKKKRHILSLCVTCDQGCFYRHSLTGLGHQTHRTAPKKQRDTGIRDLRMLRETERADPGAWRPSETVEGVREGLRVSE